MTTPDGAATASAAATPATPAASQSLSTQSLYGGVAGRRVTVLDLQRAKERGERWPMLTAYEMQAASVFDEAGVPVLLVGDSAGSVVLALDGTVPVTVEHLLPMVQSVVRATSRALVVADLPFGSYQEGPVQALRTAVRFLQQGGAQAVKLEGGRRVVPQVEALVGAGVPVMAHVGLTPQSVNVLGGYRVQGRGDDGDRLLEDALALEAAGAFAVVLEVVPADLAARVTAALRVPTVGIGAGPSCDAQVLVWQDMAGLAGGHRAKFVKPYADLRGELRRAAEAFAAEVREGSYPDEERSYR